MGYISSILIVRIIVVVVRFLCALEVVPSRARVDFDQWDRTSNTINHDLFTDILWINNNRLIIDITKEQSKTDLSLLKSQIPGKTLRLA